MFKVRQADTGDLLAINKIYNHYVINTAITFDEQIWDLTKRHQWFAAFNNGPYQLLVAEQQGVIAAFASTSAFRPKTAYSRSAEVTIYTNQEQVSKGLGTQLYNSLIANAGQHFHRLYAVIALPNEASMSLHANFGFVETGRLNEVGYKFGRYHNVAMLEKSLDQAR